MNLSDRADSRESATSRPAQESADAVAAKPAHAPNGLKLGPRWLLVATLVALVAGLAAWLVGETSLVWVAPRKVPKVTMGQRHLGTTAQTEQAAAVATAGRVYAVFGAALGLALGALGGLARLSLRGSLKAAGIGGCLGALAGFIASYSAVPLFFRYRDAIEADILVSMVLHGLIWGAVGASAALALAVGAGSEPPRSIQCVIGGALGGLIGAAAFELLGAAFFANDETGEPVSASSGSRLCARLIVAAFIAVGAALAFSERRRKRSPDPAGSASPPPA